MEENMLVLTTRTLGLFVLLLMFGCSVDENEEDSDGGTTNDTDPDTDSNQELDTDTADFEQLQADLERIGISRVNRLLPIHNDHAISIDLRVDAIMNMCEVNPCACSREREVKIAAPVLDAPAVVNAVQCSETEILSSHTIAHIIDAAIGEAIGEDPGRDCSWIVAANTEL